MSEEAFSTQPLKMTSEERLQRFHPHGDIWEVLLIG